MTASKEKQGTQVKGTHRRDFLKLAGLSAPAAAGAVAALGASPAKAAEVDPDSTTMQDTEHTRAYYNSARF